MDQDQQRIFDQRFAMSTEQAAAAFVEFYGDSVPEYLDRIDSNRLVARSLGINRDTVARWRSGGPLPRRLEQYFELALREACKGLFWGASKADIGRTLHLYKIRYKIALKTLKTHGAPHNVGETPPEKARELQDYALARLGEIDPEIRIARIKRYHAKRKRD